MAWWTWGAVNGALIRRVPASVTTCSSVPRILTASLSPGTLDSAASTVSPSGALRSITTSCRRWNRALAGVANAKRRALRRSDMPSPSKPERTWTRRIARRARKRMLGDAGNRSNTDAASAQKCTKRHRPDSCANSRDRQQVRPRPALQRPICLAIPRRKFLSGPDAEPDVAPGAAYRRPAPRSAASSARAAGRNSRKLTVQSCDARKFKRRL